MIIISQFELRERTKEPFMNHLKSGVLEKTEKTTESLRKNFTRLMK